jgi:hypothetical protein
MVKNLFINLTTKISVAPNQALKLTVASWVQLTWRA